MTRVHGTLDDLRVEFGSNGEVTIRGLPAVVSVDAMSGIEAGLSGRRNEGWDWYTSVPRGEGALYGSRWHLSGDGNRDGRPWSSGHDDTLEEARRGLAEELGKLFAARLLALGILREYTGTNGIVLDGREKR